MGLTQAIAFPVVSLLRLPGLLVVCGRSAGVEFACLVVCRGSAAVGFAGFELTLLGLGGSPVDRGRGVGCRR